jgi:hypothetical protein
MNELMKNPLVKMLLWQDLEFRTSLSLTTCENRLDDMGASIWLSDQKKGLLTRRGTAFFLKARKYSFFNQVGLSGYLEQTQDGTLVKYNFSPDRLFSNYSLLVVLFVYLLFTKGYVFSFLLVAVALINADSIFSHWSSWEYLEQKIRRELMHWKKE